MEENHAAVTTKIVSFKNDDSKQALKNVDSEIRDCEIEMGFRVPSIVRTKNAIELQLQRRPTRPVANERRGLRKKGTI